MLVSGYVSYPPPVSPLTQFADDIDGDGWDDDTGDWVGGWIDEDGDGYHDVTGEWGGGDETMTTGPDADGDGYDDYTGEWIGGDSEMIDDTMDGGSTATGTGTDDDGDGYDDVSGEWIGGGWIDEDGDGIHDVTGDIDAGGSGGGDATIDPPEGSGAWLSDSDGDGFDDLFGFWIGAYEGPMASEYLPGNEAEAAAAQAYAESLGLWDLGMAAGWPDGGMDSDGDGLSDTFEGANSSEHTEWIDDEFGSSTEVTVFEGLNPAAADTDGDGAKDGAELLSLSAAMAAAGKPRFDPLVSEATRDDDGDGVPTIEEFAIWGTDILNAHSDTDEFDDFEEIYILQTNPLDGADPGADGETLPPGGGIGGSSSGDGTGGSPNGGADEDISTENEGGETGLETNNETPPIDTGGEEVPPSTGNQSLSVEFRTKHGSWSKSLDDDFYFYPVAHGWTNGEPNGEIGTTAQHVIDFTRSFSGDFIEAPPPEAYGLQVKDQWSAYHNKYMMERGTIQSFEARWGAGNAGKHYLILNTVLNYQTGEAIYRVGSLTLAPPTNETGTYAIPTISGVTVSDIQVSGEILRITPNVIPEYLNHFVLLPVVVKDVSNDTVITDKAWIKAHTSETNVQPEMPKLEAMIVGLPDDITVKWRMEMTYDRRGGRDDMTIPPGPSEEPGFSRQGDDPWKIWEEFPLQPDYEFVGGDCVVKYELLGAGAGNIEGAIKFKILGKNPDDDRCKAHIEANDGDIWYAWAIAKHESKIYLGRTGQTYYFNQFNPPKANNENEPNFSNYGDDGWGLFQRDSSSGRDVTTLETWSWVKNMEGFIIDEYPEHIRIANVYVDRIKNANPNTFEEPQFTIEGVKISGRHVSAITSYNVGPDPDYVKFDGSKPSGQRWQLNLPKAPNKSRPYVNEILDLYNDN